VGPFAGRLTDRIGGRYILMLGFVLIAAGLTGVALVESVTSTSFTFTLPLTLAGLGMGCVIAPLTTEAMREVPPVMSGAASGMLSTSRQVGAAFGSAVVGAVLQNQLVSALHDRAVTAAFQLPPAFRQPFVSGFANAARGGLEVGRGQSGGGRLPAGLSPQAAQLVQRLAHDVFVNAYATAMRPALAVPVAALLLGALSCGLIVRRTLAQREAGL
jgi:MFS family permease